MFEREEDKAYAYLELMDDKSISIRARMEGTPGAADEGITEGLLIAICFYENVIQPQSQWKEIDTKKNEQEKLMSVVKKL